MIPFVCFLLALPCMAVVGHDIYFTYLRMERDHITFPEALQWSDLGWLWVEYAPKSYDWVHNSVNPAMWETAFLPLLEQSAVVVALIPAIVVYAYLLAARFTRLWPFADAVKKSAGKYAFERVDQHKGKMKYKRK